MLEMNSSFKNKMKKYGKQLNMLLNFGQRTIDKQYIKSAEFSINGELFTSVMRQLTLEIENYNPEEIQNVFSIPNINVQLGVRISEFEDYEYVDYGEYVIYEREEKIDTNSTKLHLYDHLIDTHVKYDDEPLSLDYLNNEITVLILLQAICNKFGFTLQTVEFANANKRIYEDKYLGLNVTYRDILDEIAAVAGGFIKIFNKDLYVAYPEETGEIIDENDLEKLTIGKKIGAFNSVVLGRSPQEDNIYYPTGIDDSDRVTIRIDNNQIMDKNREDFIIDIYNKINGLEYYVFEFSSFGFGYFEFGDIVVLKNLNGEEFSTVLLNVIENIDSGIKGKSYTEEIQYAETKYKYATGIEKRLINAEIEVNKQGGKIRQIVQQQATDKIELEEAIGATSEEFENFVDTIYAQQINSIQAQIDGQIQSYFYDYVPMLTNVPANEWVTEEEKIKHMGDLFYDSTTGLGYRFSYIDNAWTWEELKDTDVGRALANAQTAQETANSKKRVFVAQPIPPYDIGDLWITDTKELKSCIVAKANGSYEATDWQDFSYTERINEAVETVSVMEETVANLEIETDNINATVSETVTRLQNEYMTTEQVEAENQTIKDDLNIIKQQQTSVTQTAQGLQVQIDEINNEGVKTVRNTTVTIDEEGINVGKSDSEFSTTMNNTGTYMYAYQKEIARYDKDGMQTGNLKATGEVEIGHLKFVKTEVNGEKRTHIHFVE